MKFVKALFLFTIITINPLYSLLQNTHIHVFKDSEAVSDELAKVFASKLDRAKMKKKKPVFILPSEDGLIPFYQNLVKLWKAEKLDMSNAICFSLCDFVGENITPKFSTLKRLKRHLYELISNELTVQKLTSYGLRTLEIDDLTTNHLKRFSLDEINDAITTFKHHLTEAFNKGSLKSHAECEKLYWNVLRKLQKQKEIFVQLDSHVFNNKVLPISSIIVEGIYKDTLCRKYGLSKHRIFYPRIEYHKGFNAKISAENYKKTFHDYLSKPNEYDFSIFITLGSDYSEIGYNHLSLETDFNEKSEDLEKVKSKSIRVIPLSMETRSCLSENTQNTPDHVIGFGPYEFLNVNDVLVLGFGTTRQNSVYKIFSTQAITSRIPGSLLEASERYKSCFYIDEKAYGYEARSKQNLRSYVQHEIDSASKYLNIYYHNLASKTLFEVPPLSKPSVTLNPNVESIHDLVNVVSLPKRHKILFVKQSPVETLDFINLLILKKNHIDFYEYKNVKHLVEEISSKTPDILFLPSSLRTSTTMIPKIKKALSEKKYDLPLLGIYYGNKRATHDFSLPLTPITFEKKADSLRKFHHSQVGRTPFDTIVKHLASYYDLKIGKESIPNENFKTYHLTLQKGNVHLKRLSKRIFSFDEQELLLPEEFQTFKMQPSDKVIAISPHPDDVEIGMGGFIHECQKAKIAPVVLVATTGNHIKIYANDVNASFANSQAIDIRSGEIIDKNYKTMIREFETMNSLKFLNPLTNIESLKLSYYDTKSLSFKDRSDAFKSLEKHLVNQSGRIFIFVPRHDDTHPTHEMTTELFYKTTKEFFKAYPDKDIYLAFYNTPWSGKWNLYHYNNCSGNKLAALVGAEIVHGIGLKAFDSSLLGGPLAERYFCFDIVAQKPKKASNN